jgi:hypothetical protein
MSEDELAVFGGVLLDEFGEELVEEPLFGEVLVEEPLGEVLLDAPEFTPVPLCVLAPALPEMLPAVFMSLLALPWLELGLELDAVPALPPAVDPEALALATSRLSFTFFTPATDLAIRLASFLSSLLATVPLSLTVPFSTSTCTFCRFGFVASCS